MKKLLQTKSVRISSHNNFAKIKRLWLENGGVGVCVCVWARVCVWVGVGGCVCIYIYVGGGEGGALEP